ncbi:sodium-dependent transporter [Prolixibacter denitrificans]|uniref:Transporter n=1 Tax=Prolixibacter denitrificans TaxID=1541063 RepID=A0A2P8CJE7_9BACT|nr:sodium-dependent transporter [Prolixibacter denitrificans]PSK85090.1 NSS family neurotransmitter:Na+ symporter [Prolixibacter denitrificans]GET23632.1 transporter [Prolixibacter denitrificans]
MQGNRDSFSSRFGVIAAAAGSAIGLGNIWRFPYVLGENGGGAFFLMYLFFIVLIGIPLMLTEMTLGRSAQRNAYGTFKFLAPKTGWPAVGIMGVAAAFLILSFYSAVAGWTLEYTLQAVKNGFTGKTPVELNAMYNDFVSGSVWPVVWMLIFLFLTAAIVVAGVQKGIEKYTKILMPVLLVIIIILDIRAITLPGAGEGLDFLFKPDFSKLSANTVLEALGQAFFSLSLGMGTIITYGSYINRKERLMSTAASVSLADTLIAVLAGVAIFPAVFAFNIEPDAGPKLVFITLPNIFQQMPGGYFFALLFFVLLVIAALTSSISLLEVIVAYFTEELKISRKKATWLSGATVGVLGVLSALSYGPLKDNTLFDKTAFDLFDYVSSNILLPFGGLLITIFAGYILKKAAVKDGVEGESGHEKLFKVYYFIIKFLAPVAIAFVFLNSLGILKF